MPRYRTTYITDDDGKVEHGSYVVEPIPEPNRVQEFRVRVETPADWSPWSTNGVRNALVSPTPVKVTVTEVDPQ